MRILLTLASSSVTGPAERMLGDAEVLRAAGHEVAVAFDTRLPGNLAGACAVRRLPVANELKLCRHSGPLETLRDLRALRRRLRSLDLVHTHFSHDHHLVLLAARGLSNRPRVVRSLESVTTGSRWALARTHGIEVPSRALLAQPRLAGIRAVVEAVPNAVDAQRFSPGPSTALRDELGIPRAARLVGIVARVKPDRHHLDLVDAFRSVVAAIPEAHLAIVGRGELAPAQARVAELGLERSIHFAGYWSGPRLVEAYRALDVAVWLAPGNDGGARGVLEAMAVGLPLVSYDVAPMAEQLARGAGTVSGEAPAEPAPLRDPLLGVSGATRDIEVEIAGVLVPDRNVEALGHALIDLLGDSERRAALGTRARERVLHEYTWAVRGPRLLVFYENVLKRR